jgi:Bacterial membrane protein YfhO
VISAEPSTKQHAVAAAFMVLLVGVALFPYVFGFWTLQDSAARGVFTDGRPAQNQLARNQDPISAAVIQEPDFALDHILYLREHQPPIWNPYTGFGQPLAAGMLAQAYSPLAWVAIVWNSARGYDVFLVLRIAVGGWLSYLFLRQFVGFRPAFAGGIAFAFSGALWTYFTIQDLTVEVMIPGLFFAVERLVRDPGPRSTGVAALIFAVTTLGGQPEPEMIAAAVAVLYWLARALCVREYRRALLPVLGASAAAVVLGAGASAILILPVLEYVPLAWNQHVGGGELPWGHYSDNFAAIESLRYVAPLAGGPIHHDIFKQFAGDTPLKAFFGCVAAFFALAAVYERLGSIYERLRLRQPLEWDTPVLFFAAVVAVLLMKRFGVYFINWIGYLPILWRTTWVKYEEPTTAFAFAALAGFGAALLVSKRLSRTAAALSAGTLLALIAKSMLPYKDLLPQASHPEFFVLSVGAAIVFLGAAYGVSVTARRDDRSIPIAGAAIALMALEPFVTWIVPMYYVFAPGLPQSASPLRGIDYVSYLRSKLRPGERVVGEAAMLLPEWAQAFAIPNVTANTPLYPDRYLPFVQNLAPQYDLEQYRVYSSMNSDFHDALTRRFLALSSIAHVLVGCPVEVPTGCDNVTAAKTVPGFAQEYGAPLVAIFRFGDALPRLGLFRRIVPAKDASGALATLRSSAFDAAAEAVVEQPAAELAPLEAAPKTHVVAGTIATYESRYVRGVVDAPDRSLAVLTDTWFPGWRAFVDAREQPIVRANYLFRGVLVPAGRHVVEFRYEPPSFLLGSILTGLSLAAIAALIVISSPRRSP